MTLHICRDLPLGGYSSGSYDTMWAVNAFMQGVIGYTRVGSAGNIPPPAYADFVVTYYSASLSTNTLTQISSSLITIHTASCFMSGSGSTALVVFSTDTVNLMSAAFPVGWPVANGPWPLRDPFSNTLVAGEGNLFQGMWLAIKSAQFPRANSGLFVVTAASASLPQNALVIDYRSPSAVLPETTQELTCSVWLPPPGSDVNYTSLLLGRGVARTGGTWGAFLAMIPNAVASNTYTSQGAAPNARVLLQSPDPSGYQVRLCIEKPTDQQYGQVGGWNSPSLTMIPGFSGSGGDFLSQSYATPRNQPHLHASQWFNNYIAVNGNPLVGGTLVGHDTVNVASIGINGSYQTSHRFYAWGDDQTGTCVIITRGHPFVQSTFNRVYDVWSAFGIPEDETQPLPLNNVSRLFVIGNNQSGNDRVSWDCGSYAANGVSGIAYSLDMRFGPISCTMAQYVYASIAESDGIYGGSYPTPRFDSAAGDTPFLSGTELISVDLLAGTWGNLYQANGVYGGDACSGGLPAGGLNLEPRRLGRFPFARLGWATGRPAWVTIDPAMNWFHANNGFYLPWGGIGSL